ncbi:MAG TPA: ThiF family adenylyltransferase, partial [Chloroflexia bacterium]|nr:ThiF family adenylyltransferase [Chloroflexia bacterium]
QKAGKEVSLRLVDPDLVEEKNLTRQHFARAELGLPKAACLALRYGSAWGVEVGAVTEKFSQKMVQNQAYGRSGEKLTLVVGCVDNAAARVEMAATLKLNSSTKGTIPRIWYLDCGNYREGGQVLLGSAADPLQLKEAFSLPGVCTWLPSPALQHPELLTPLPEELAENRLYYSCADLALREAQSLSVNFQIAAVAADYVLRLFLVGGLKKYATYLHLPTGVTRSRYTVPGELMDYYRRPGS